MTTPTRDFKQTIADRLQNDPAFAQAIDAEAAALMATADPEAQAIANELRLIGGLRGSEGRLAKVHALMARPAGRRR